MPQKRHLLFFLKLLLDDLQNFHGASLNANAAGDALGSGILGLENHNLHGAGLDTLAAADAVLLIDHVHTGLGILGDGAGFANLFALTALDTGHGFRTGTLGNDLNARQVFIEFFEERSGTGTNALQAGHTFHILFDGKLFHKDINPLSPIFAIKHYTALMQK